MLMVRNQAFLVSDESGEGIAANPRPPGLHCPTGSRRPLSGGNAAPLLALPGTRGWTAAGWHCPEAGPGLALRSSGLAAGPPGGGASAGKPFPAAPG